MTLDEVERIEQTALSMVAQALTDCAEQAAVIFREETDQPQDIAEDVTREAIEAMGMSGLRDRLYGKVDVKKAIYVFLPEAHPVALMLDAKAEKPRRRTTDARRRFRCRKPPCGSECAARAPTWMNRAGWSRRFSVTAAPSSS